MKMFTRADGDLFQLEVIGEIDVYNSPELWKLLKSKIETVRRVYIYLEKVSYIDSSGIGVLIQAAEKMRRRFGELILVRPSFQLKYVLSITGLGSFFHILESGKEESRVLAT